MSTDVVALMPALQAIQGALSAIPDVAVEIGRRLDLSPNDYPMIQIVPIRLFNGKYGERLLETWIYFSEHTEHVDGMPQLYGSLSALEKQVIDAMSGVQGEWQETITDQDTQGVFKEMAARFNVSAVPKPSLRCVLYTPSLVIELSETASVLPADRVLHNGSDDDWATDLPNGELIRLLNGASSTNSRLVATGLLAGSLGDEVVIGIYADGVLTGNRVLLISDGPDDPVPFSLTVEHVATVDVSYALRATGDVNEYSLTKLRLDGQAI